MRSLRLGTLAGSALLLLATSALADPDGEQIFKRSCGVCHSIQAGQNRVGPSLAGVVGRKSGTIEGYAYSTANKNSGLTWDAATLDKYLTNPREMVPGTKMAFPGLKDEADRKAVIAYLQAH